MRIKSAHPLPPHNHKLHGFTLFEIMVTMAILAVVVTIAILLSLRSRANQALAISAEELANQAKTAHIYAREAKDSKAWGLRRTGSGSYAVIAGTKESYDTIYNLSLESKIEFVNSDFTVWFDIGTGETDASTSIELTNMSGRKAKVDIYKTGLIETTGLY